MPARWNADEDGLLRRLYRDGVSIAEIARIIGRSPDGVAERRRTLRIAARPRSRPWTEREEQLVRAAAASNLPASALAVALGRTADEVRRRRSTLVGAVQAARPYSASDDDAIRAGWVAGHDLESLARELSRSPGALRLRARKLGLHAPSPRRRWVPAEDAAVRDGYERGLTCGQIATELSGRTASAVAARAAKLGVATYARVWSPNDDRDLRQLIREGLELEQIAQRLRRTPEALRARTRKLGLASPRSREAARGRRRWTVQEDDRLRLHVGLNPAALAEMLDRSPEAITQRLRRLGLRQGAERSPHHPVVAGSGLTPGERATILREMQAAGPMRHLAIARRLQIPPAHVQDAIRFTRTPPSDPAAPAGPAVRSR